MFDLHYAATARFVFQLSSDFTREDAEEICQESFLAVIKNITSFSGQSRLQTWIFRIAANKARDYHERRQAIKRGGGQVAVSLQTEIPGTKSVLDLPSPTPGPDALLMNAEDAGQMGLALDQLGDACREIVQLRYFGDLSYDEIAAELKLNPKTVSSRLSKCLDRLEEIVVRVFGRKKSTAFPV
jgi:RNA polymerase sigma-70 factor (ECF subfamily)